MINILIKLIIIFPFFPLVVLILLVGKKNALTFSSIFFVACIYIMLKTLVDFKLLIIMMLCYILFIYIVTRVGIKKRRKEKLYFLKKYAQNTTRISIMLYPILLIAGTIKEMIL